MDIIKRLRPAAIAETLARSDYGDQIQLLALDVISELVSLEDVAKDNRAKQKFLFEENKELRATIDAYRLVLLDLAPMVRDEIASAQRVGEDS